MEKSQSHLTDLVTSNIRNQLLGIDTSTASQSHLTDLVTSNLLESADLDTWGGSQKSQSHLTDLVTSNTKTLAGTAVYEGLNAKSQSHLTSHFLLPATTFYGLQYILKEHLSQSHLPDLVISHCDPVGMPSYQGFVEESQSRLTDLVISDVANPNLLTKTEQFESQSHLPDLGPVIPNLPLHRPSPSRRPGLRASPHP